MPIRAAIAWRIDGDVLHVEAIVPTGADATIELPGAEPVVLASGTHAFEHALPAALLSNANELS